MFPLAVKYFPLPVLLVPAPGSPKFPGVRIEYTIDRTRGLIRTVMSGAFHVSTFAHHLEEVLHDPGFDPHFDALIVAQDEAALPGPRSRAAIAEKLVVWSERRRGSSWAFVVPSVAAREKAERGFHEIEIESVKLAFFLNETDACVWLAASRREFAETVSAHGAQL